MLSQLLNDAIAPFRGCNLAAKSATNLPIELNEGRINSDISLLSRTLNQLHNRGKVIGFRNQTHFAPDLPAIADLAS